MRSSAARLARFIVGIALAVVLSIFPLWLRGQDQPTTKDALSDCSVSKTNRSCKLTIDRSNPVAPPTVQMYSDQTLTVVIQNPLPFERYFLDFTTGQATAMPDQASAIVTAVSGDLAKLTQIILPAPQNKELLDWQADTSKPTACESLNLSDSTWPARGGVTDVELTFKKCFRQLADLAIPLYKDLEPLVAPDALTSTTVKQEPDYFFNQRVDSMEKIEAYIHLETAVSTKITTMSKVTVSAQESCPANPPAGAPPCPPYPPTYTPDDASAITALSDYQKLIDAVSADLAGYDQRIADLGLCGYGNAKGDKRTGSYCWRGDRRYSIGTRVVDANGKVHMLKSAQNQCKEPDSRGEKLQCEEPNNDIKNWINVDDLTAPSKGPYLRDKQYKSGDEVTFKGAIWTCIDNCQGTLSSRDGSWLEFSERQATPRFITITSRTDDQSVYQNMVTRTITYSLDTLNLISYSQQAAPSSANKKAVASIPINFADRPNSIAAALPSGTPYSALRWEASAGVFFSWLPARTFTVLNGTVVDSKTRPTPVPFAAGNYRLTGDFGKRWKQNVYLTGAIGINANNTTAEFGVGPSYSWRGLMINFLCHFGHDVRPSSTTPSGSSSTLPTISHWTEAAAIGISVRLPSLTGR